MKRPYFRRVRTDKNGKSSLETHEEFRDRCLVYDFKTVFDSLKFRAKHLLGHVLDYQDRGDLTDIEKSILKAFDGK